MAAPGMYFPARPPRGQCVTRNTFEDGTALYLAVCEQGLEGIVAKRSAGLLAPGESGRYGGRRSRHMH